MGYDVAGERRDAGLWMRADSGTRVLTLDNMSDRALTGTRPWTPLRSVRVDRRRPPRHSAPAAGRCRRTVSQRHRAANHSYQPFVITAST
jgi:hypothetical protein